MKYLFMDSTRRAAFAKGRMFSSLSFFQQIGMILCYRMGFKCHMLEGHGKRYALEFQEPLSTPFLISIPPMLGPPSQSL